MKNLFLFFCLIFSTALLSQNIISGPKKSGDGLNDGSTTTTGSPTRMCCSKIFISTPSQKGGKATRRLLSGNPFKGKERGIDLTFDFLDPQGAVVEGLDNAISTDASGNTIVNAAKLPAGKKLRLRAKAGKSSETYALN